MTPLATSLMTATLRPRLMSMTQLGTHRGNDNILKSIGLKIENILNELLSIQYIDLLWILYPGYRPGLSMIATFSFICILYKQLMSVSSSPFVSFSFSSKIDGRGCAGQCCVGRRLLLLLLDA